MLIDVLVCKADGTQILEQQEVELTPEPEEEPTQLDRIEAQATYTAMMTDTLLGV